MLRARKSSFRPVRRRSLRGFTLLEVLVVVVIMAIVTAATVLSTGLLSDDRELAREADRLVALIDLAGEEALLQGRELGLLIEPEQYRFFVFDAQSNRWLPLENDDVLRTRELPEGGRIALAVEGRDVVLSPHSDNDDAEKDFAPQIMILSSGAMTPFEIELERDIEPYRFSIRGEPNGRTEIEKHEL